MLVFAVKATAVVVVAGFYYFARRLRPNRFIASQHTTRHRHSHLRINFTIIRAVRHSDCHMRPLEMLCHRYLQANARSCASGICCWTESFVIASGFATDCQASGGQWSGNGTSTCFGHHSRIESFVLVLVVSAIGLASWRWYKRNGKVTR